MDAVERIVSTRVSQLQSLSVVLSSLGFFMTAESVAFLGVTPTERLLRVQRAVAAEVLPIAVGYWNYYRPDAFVPHCTLARRGLLGAQLQLGDIRRRRRNERQRSEQRARH